MAVQLLWSKSSSTGHAQNQASTTVLVALVIVLSVWFVAQAFSLVDDAIPVEEITLPTVAEN